MPKFSTNNLLDKEEKKSRYAGLLVDQIDQLDLKKENEFASKLKRKLTQRRKKAPLPD
jgi:hypothetical protein